MDSEKRFEWHSPLRLDLIPTSDSESYKSMREGETGLPLAPHPGAFGVRRKFHSHEGIDLYCSEGTPVYSVEPGEIVEIIPFTGKLVNSPWWNDTMAVLVEGASGVVVYGEIIPVVQVGEKLDCGALIGHVKQVLTKDKGRPMAMLHLELHSKGARDAPEWVDERPDTLLDPTEHLLNCRK